MTELRDFLDPGSVAQLERLQVVARKIVGGFLRGLHRSAARGSSIEYAEHRPYVPGDDLKHLDWRSYARTDRFYLKQFEDETNLRATPMLDTPASMAFRWHMAASPEVAWEWSCSGRSTSALIAFTSASVA